jgi:acetylglutamate kinase
MPEQLYIVKVGSNVIDNNIQLNSFLKKFSSIEGHKILVHGGGKLATDLAAKLKIEQKMVDGRRITDEETLKIATMVYAGYVNKNIVAELQSNHCNAIGVCGADGDIILAHKRKHPVLDFGFVGDIDSVNTVLLKNLLEQNITVVIAPLTHDGQGQLLNTNADTIAQEIAKAMSHLFEVELIFCFEKKGVLENVNDEASLIPVMNDKLYAGLKLKEKIFSGMIPKLDNAFQALKSGVNKVVIGKAEELEQLISGKSGTTIVHD